MTLKCHAEPKAKHLGLERINNLLTIEILRFAQDDNVNRSI